MVKRYFAASKNYLWPIVFGGLNGFAIHVYFLSYDSIEYFRSVGWPIAAFALGATLAFATAFCVRNYSRPIKTLAHSTIAISTLTISLYFIYPYIFLNTTPLIETNLHDICCETPMDYGAASYESLKLTMPDGTIISSWYVPPRLHLDSMIILVHGRFNDRRGTALWAKDLIGAGYGIFMYDQRGNGESTGVLNFIKPHLAADLLEITRVIKQKTGAHRLGVVGLSMGAHAVINALDKDQSIFTAVWLDGLFAQSLKDLPEDAPLKTRFSYWIDDRLLNMLQLQHRDYENVPAVTDILTAIHTTQLMLVAGGQEDLENDSNRRFAQFSNRYVHSWIIADGHHLSGPDKIPDEYRTRLVEFFNGALVQPEVAREH